MKWLLLCSILIIHNMNAQNKIRVGYDKGCHLYNSSLLQDIVEKSISKEDLINIISNKIDLNKTSLVKNDFMNIFKIHIVFNTQGKMEDIIFINSPNNELKRKYFKSIKKHIKKNQIDFKICYNDLSTIYNYSDTELKSRGMVNLLNFVTGRENYIMSIYYPGFIDERFLENIK